MEHTDSRRLQSASVYVVLGDFWFDDRDVEDNKIKKLVMISGCLLLKTWISIGITLCYHLSNSMLLLLHVLSVTTIISKVTKRYSPDEKSTFPRDITHIHKTYTANAPSCLDWCNTNEYHMVSSLLVLENYPIYSYIL